MLHFGVRPLKLFYELRHFILGHLIPLSEFQRTFNVCLHEIGCHCSSVSIGTSLRAERLEFSSNQGQ